MQRIVSLARTITIIGRHQPNKVCEAVPLCYSVQNYRELLQPYTPIFSQVCGMKVKGKVRRRCQSCYLVVRDERYYNMCSKHPRHKQMAMKAKPLTTYILTHASQSRFRQW